MTRHIAAASLGEVWEEQAALVDMIRDKLKAVFDPRGGAWSKGTFRRSAILPAAESNGVKGGA